MRKRSLIKRTTAELLLVLALFVPAQSATALSSDKDQPVEVEADTAEIDDIKNKSVYTGNVILIQGTIRMTGDRMTVYHTENDELDTLIMEGDPATYRQLPDDSDIYDEAEAQVIEYYELQNLVILIENAEVRQEGLTMTGDRIDYDTELSQVKATSKTGPAKAGKEEPGEKKRVKVILKKKKEETEAETDSPAAPDNQ